MNVPSSISSSNRRLPRLAWRKLLGGGLAILVLFVAVMELRLAARGFMPSVIDSPALWLRQRERADALGAHALIIVGSSRALLDLDLDTLRRETGLEPVQLAVDGSSFVPVLAGLADDPAIRGTVLVDFAQHILTVPAVRDAAYAYQDEYARKQGSLLPDFRASEDRLSDLLHGGLRSYADGTRPITALRLRILDPAPTSQYLRMLPDREVLADYSRVPMPEFYFARVMRNLGESVPTDGKSYTEIEAELKARIAAMPAVDNAFFLRSLPAIGSMTRSIQSHGGRLLYVNLPTSGDVRALDEHRFPRALFWDRFSATAGAPTLHFEDVPALASFFCPDGSHLDYRDRARFTEALVGALHLAH